MARYSLSDFDRIKKAGFSYVLPADVLQIIQSVAEQVGAPGYIKTPSFEKRAPTLRLNIGRQANAGSGSGHGSGQGHGTAPRQTEDWESLRKFQATVMVKQKGVDAALEQIRKHLNKITAKTYSVLKDQIIQEIEIIVGLDAEDALNKIGEAMFSIASGNIFYADMYATLYKELMLKFVFMKSIFDVHFLAADKLFHDFAYCAPQDDYDQFCANNKVNERRRALSHFYVNLLKQGILQAAQVLPIIQETQDLLLKQIDLANGSNIADEAAEILAIFLMEGAAHLKREPAWLSVKEVTVKISTLKRQEHLSLTNKTIFKHLDILDKLAKEK